MKVWLRGEESYDVVVYSEPKIGTLEREVSEGLWERYRVALLEFEAVQEELRKLSYEER